MKDHRFSLIKACIAVITFTVGAGNANGSVFNFDVTGVFTVLNSSGNFIQNNDAGTNIYSGFRTNVVGQYSYDDVFGTGVLSIDAFNFFGGGALTFAAGNTTDIGGNLILGNFTFDWNNIFGLHADLVWDATGLFDALADPNLAPGSVISGNQLLNNAGPSPVAIGSVLPASDAVMSGANSFPIGPTPMATTSFDLTGGTLPLVVDPSGIAGSPGGAGPYQGDSISLDIGNAGSMHLISITPSPVPVPATVWLFGSGLLGLAGMARHRRVG